jgi:diguanylate cyclase (GGDEF)-like protein
VPRLLPFHPPAVALPRSQKAQRPAGWIALATVLALAGSAAAAFGAFGVAHTDAQRSREAFAASSADVVSTLQLALEREEDLIVSASSFFLSDPSASNVEFGNWTTSMRAFARYPELRGVGITVLVSAAQLPAFAARAAVDPAGPLAADGTFRVTPPQTGLYSCLALIGAVPVPGSGPPADTNYCSGTAAGAFLASRDSGQAIYLPSYQGSVTTLSFIVPIYRGGTPGTTVAARRGAFVGWAGDGTLPAILLKTALSGHPGMAVSMRYRVGSSSVAFQSGPASRGGQTVTIDLQNGWTIQTFGAVIDGGVPSNGGALALLLGGIVLSLLLGVLVYILGTGRGRARRLVERKTAELQHLALHDALTGLPNRALILDRVEQALSRSRREGSPLGLLFLDLDGFKDINDTFGHAAGDQLLRGVAGRLSGVLRDSDTVGRLGGDEFVVLVEGGSIEHPTLVAERIQAVLAEPFPLSGTDDVVVHTHASIGIALGVRPTADELLRDADVALYEAKEAGRDRFVHFAPEMQVAVQDRMQLETDLRESEGKDEFFLVYQPTFDLRTGNVTGVEALLRWQHPTRGLVMPDTFIPVAEQTGIMVPLGRWVLVEACRRAADWERSGHPLAISVNISGRQLDTGPALLETVREVLAETGLAPGLLSLEIAESLLMRDATNSARQLRALKTLGVRLAIDDFGTGYSSMAHLHQFPVDALKIDRSFISGIANSPESPALIRTLVQLGRTLGIETLAEGIEDKAQLQALRREQCDSGQGYLFARPLSLNDLELFIGHLSRPADSHPPDPRLSTTR